MKNVIRVGDTLRPYGGTVFTGQYLAFGKPVACVGESAKCNRHGHTTTVLEGLSAIEGVNFTGRPKTAIPCPLCCAPKWGKAPLRC